MAEVHSGSGGGQSPPAFKLFGSVIVVEETLPRKRSPPEEEAAAAAATLPCPRCNSRETKFCYFNNYNVNQPRHFCKACHRY
ncbi:hypothetical protein HPP92_008056 [Vanilla planifolia]|uniref:Dof-type domain-containing protein n=1 Tax=Vanilla planifolia TaxID=51239 RepID=A0A835RHR1_VANPL|nr:hypothetical protein HPP92_008020 [Vanilla planifolia]KAG0491193.1 hypothetical protein HPP92_008056 [Vanilla planifolia]